MEIDLFYLFGQLKLSFSSENIKKNFYFMLNLAKDYITRCFLLHFIC